MIYPLLLKHISKFCQERFFKMLNFVFFISGIAGLIYQLSWQRIALRLIGVDLYATSIIVSAFMLGLGLGAISFPKIILLCKKSFNCTYLRLFAILETLIGLIGFISPLVLNWLDALNLSTTTLTVSIFGMLLIPTFLMGMTLPILVFYLQTNYQHIGNNTGRLYHYNTLGAASGAFLTGFVLFKYLGITMSIWVACMLNFLVALIVFTYFLRKGS